MHTLVKTALTLVAATVAAHASAQLTAYEHRDFGGRSITVNEALDNFTRMDFNDRASSLVVANRAWEVCEDVEFRGRCMILAPGYYPSLMDAGMNDRISSARELHGDARHPPERYAPALPAPQVTLYDGPDFQGRAVTLMADAADFRPFSFNDRAASVVVLGQPWEACEDIQFGGRCVVLRPGRYPDLGAIGMADRLSSVRMLGLGSRIDERRYVAVPAPAYDWRRRPHEHLFEADVIAVRAVYSAPQHRCWVERERVVIEEPRAEGLRGGIMSHQVDGGTGHEGAGMAILNMQRCVTLPPQGRPDYWDVSYEFRGVRHHLQAKTLPGPTVTVNEQGEPRQPPEDRPSA